MSNDNHLWKSICQKAGIKDIVFHYHTNMSKMDDWKSLFVKQYKKFLNKRLYERFLSLQQTSQFNELSNIIAKNPLAELLQSKTCEICEQLNKSSSYHSGYAFPVSSSPIYIRTSDILQHTLSPDCNYSGPLSELTKTFTLEKISSKISMHSIQSSPSTSSNHSSSSPITIEYQHSFKNDMIIKWN
jgi:hypothetical protein